MISGSLSMLFPGHEPAQEQAGDKGAADGRVWFYMNKLISGLDLIQELGFKLAVVALG
jgi:hypothetical protein